MDSHAQFAASHPDCGSKLLGGGVVPTADPAVFVTYVVVKTVDGRVRTIFPELAAKLSSLASYKARNRDLVLMLRLRAFEWSREVGLSWVNFHHGFHGSLSFAFDPSGSELDEGVSEQQLEVVSLG